MKALTLWQPWASLVVYGEKKVETRCWSTGYRGLLAIHSAKTTPKWLGESRKSQEFHDAMMTIAMANGMFDTGMPEGVVLGIAKLISIEPTEKVCADLSTQEQLFGNYEEGRFAWFLEMVERFEKPVPAKGNRMLWNWKRP